MARTAVIAGTATAVSGGMTRHANKKAMEQQQAEAYQQQQQAEQMAAAAAAAAPPPPPAAPAEDETVAKLKEYADLKAQGILSEEEFASAKAKLLGL
jgi:hypothetical protein